MRAPSLVTQCLPELVTHDRGGHSITFIPEKDIHLPSPAVEILPSKTVHPYKYIGENEDFQGVNFECLRPPYGVVYLATKNYVGFNNGARHLRSLVDEEGIFGAHLIKVKDI